MRGPKTVSAWAVREKGKDSKVTQEENRQDLVRRYLGKDSTRQW